MTIAQIIEILEKRIVCLESQKAAAYAEGNMDLYSEFDMQIQECETSLVILRPHA
jgi:hypothetical protein